VWSDPSGGAAPAVQPRESDALWYDGYQMLGLDAVAEATYRALLVRPDDDISGLAHALGREAAEVSGALDRLRERGLVRPADHVACGVTTISPELALAATLAQREADLAQRRQRLEQGRAAMARLVADYAVSGTGRHERRVEQVRGGDAVEGRIAALVAAATAEVVWLDIGTWRVTDPSRRAGAFSRACAAHGRVAAGVEVRAVYLDVLRNDVEPLRRLQESAAAGVQVRTQPSLPMGMLLVDRSIAVLPDGASATTRDDSAQETDGESAVLVASPPVAQALGALFDGLWRTAAPLDRPSTPDGAGLGAAERELLRLLGTGLTDEAASIKLGMSLRTVRRMMSELMGRLEAKSRFQAGVQVAERRWL
jgi:DNA-binding CsgD family transcriptional regulator